ncbi:uncharacterized protein RHO17_018929 [Thomomys bottae]
MRGGCVTALVTVHSELGRSRDFASRRPLHGSPLCPARLSAPPPATPPPLPGRRGSFSLPDQSSTSWRKTVAQGLSSGIRNYQDRDAPTQYSNLYTYLAEPRFAAGQTPVGGRGEGREGCGPFGEGCASSGLPCGQTGPARSRSPLDPGDQTVPTHRCLPKGWPLRQEVSKVTEAKEPAEMSSGVPEEHISQKSQQIFTVVKKRCR